MRTITWEGVRYSAYYLCPTCKVFFGASNGKTRPDWMPTTGVAYYHHYYKCNSRSVGDCRVIIGKFKNSK